MKKMTNKKTKIPYAEMKADKAGPSKMPAKAKKGSNGKNMGLVDGMKANVKKQKAKSSMY